MLENEIEYDYKGFEYEEGMNFTFDGDSNPSTLGIFENIEDAKKELKKHKSEIRKVGNRVLVTEYYIQDGIFDEDDEFVSGSNLFDVAPLEK